MARRGRHREGAETRENILDAACRLIAAKGYAATSIAELSRESGAKSASIYWAFESKEGVLAAAIERSAAAFRTAVSRCALSQDPFEGLHSLADYFADGPEFLRLVLVLSLERQAGAPDILAAARRVRADALAVLEEGYSGALALEDAETRARIASELAHITLLLIDGIAVEQLAAPDASDIRHVCETLALGVRATGEHLVERVSRSQ